MSCQEVKDLLYLYLSEELEEDERLLVVAHLETCKDCQVAYQEHLALKAALESRPFTS